MEKDPMILAAIDTMTKAATVWFPTPQCGRCRKGNRACSSRYRAKLIYLVFYISKLHFLEPNTSIASLSYGRSWP
jgi:hypothetical protein